MSPTPRENVVSDKTAFASPAPLSRTLSFSPAGKSRAHILDTRCLTLSVSASAILSAGLLRSAYQNEF